MNQVNVIGRLTHDPELKSSESGNNYCNFSIAVNRNFKNQAGEYEADFFNCSAFGKTAELICNYFQKGNQIGLTGELRTNKKDDRIFTNISVNNITFLSNNTPENNQGSVFADEQNEPNISINDDDLPF